MVDASEVAYVVAFLVSEKAVAINGEGIGVAGGRRGSLRY
jgi:NAD(P)-dependent dehydrogenase (short-subunit alcohol dehydrogenase family)